MPSRDVQKSLEIQDKARI